MPPNQYKNTIFKYHNTIWWVRPVSRSQLGPEFHARIKCFAAACSSQFTARTLRCPNTVTSRISIPWRGGGGSRDNLLQNSIHSHLSQFLHFNDNFTLYNAREARLFPFPSANRCPPRSLGVLNERMPG